MCHHSTRQRLALETARVEVVGHYAAVFAVAAHDRDGRIARESDLHGVFLLDYLRTRDIVEPLLRHNIYTTIPKAEWSPDVQNVNFLPGFNPPNQLFSGHIGDDTTLIHCHHLFGCGVIRR